MQTKGIIDMKAVLRALLPILVTILIIGGCSPKASDIIVLEVGQSKVSLAEYENFYTRNSGGWETARNSSIEERTHFLDLLTNYKLKLQDAVDRNLLNDTDVVREMNEYRASLASTFMLDREVTEPGIQNLFNHKKEEIRAKHILLKLAPNASPEETLKVYIKAMEIIRRAKSGEIFDSLAVQYSEDPSVKMNYGDLYYFTGGQMVAPFENAAFALKMGEITTVPARSPFGFHIIKITDRQFVRGSIRVSHIMARFKNSAADSADTVAALARIKGIQDSLKLGMDFHSLARKISEDGGSAQQGGDLGWFERRRFVQPFDEAAFKLKVGEVSNIVRTPYGYHLILCDSAKPFPPITDQKNHDELKKVYTQQKYNDDYASYIARLKKDYNYSFNEQVFNKFVSSLDSSKTTNDSAWSSSVPHEVGKQPLMTIDGRQITMDSVTSLLETRQEYINTPLRSIDLMKHLDRITNAFLLDHRSVGLEQRSPEFAALMKEYSDGIILYKAEQMEVWGKTSVSDSSLEEYYNKNKDKFYFTDRVNISVLSFEADTLAAFVYDSLQHGANFDELLGRYKENPPPKSKDGSRGLQSVNLDTLTRRAWTLSVGQISDPVQTEGGMWAIMKLISKEPARQKTFSEAGAEVSNSYQEYTSKLMEQQWLERVKQTHPVKQYKEVLPKAFASPPPSK